MNNEHFEELRKNFLPRFWDTENKVMIYPKLTEDIVLGYPIITYKVAEHIVWQLDLMLLSPRFIIMKPTGLLDKGKNLIYELDIVEDNYSSRYDVLWNQEGYWEIYDIQTTKTEFLNYPSNCEITGDIHTDKGE